MPTIFNENGFLYNKIIMISLFLEGKIRLTEIRARLSASAMASLCQDSCRITQIPYSMRGQKGEQDDDSGAVVV